MVVHLIRFSRFLYENRRKVNITTVKKLADQLIWLRCRTFYFSSFKRTFYFSSLFALTGITHTERSIKHAKSLSEFPIFFFRASVKNLEICWSRASMKIVRGWLWGDFCVRLRPLFGNSLMIFLIEIDPKYFHLNIVICIKKLRIQKQRITFFSYFFEKWFQTI